MSGLGPRLPYNKKKISRPHGGYNGSLSADHNIYPCKYYTKNVATVLTRSEITTFAAFDLYSSQDDPIYWDDPIELPSWRF